MSLWKAIVDELDGLAEGQVAEAIRASGKASALAFEGALEDAAAEFERAARLCVMAGETNRCKRVVEREASRLGPDQDKKGQRR